LKINNELLELSEQDFVELMETGLLYKLYPDLKGGLFNVAQFSEAKEQYLKSLQAQQIATDLFYELAAMTGADPAELWEVLEENLDELNFAINNSDMFEVEYVMQYVREQLNG
jgi:hypothetical protein